MSTSSQRLSPRLLGCVLLLLAHNGWTEPARLFRTSGFQAPVQGGPGDLLWLAGSGFHDGDRVEYSGPDAQTGKVEIVAATPGQGLVVRLPAAIRPDATYSLTVVSAGGERSRPAQINDPRPQWLTPSVLPAVSGIPGVGRTLRIVGRNLFPRNGRPAQVRLSGPVTYTLAPLSPHAGSRSLGSYLVEAQLPARMTPGSYRVGVRYGNSLWSFVPDQELRIIPEPATNRRHSLDDPGFGGCRPGSDRSSDTCLTRALQAAGRAGGGTILIPPGTWRLSSSTAPGGDDNGFLIGPNINIEGSSDPARPSVLLRTDPLDERHHCALFTLLGHNVIRNLHFTDDAPFTSPADTRPILRIGPRGAGVLPENPKGSVTDIVVADNHFDLVGVGIMDDGGWPLSRLVVVGNEFAAFSDGMELAGGTPRPGMPFRIDDSIFRWNRFAPGRYTDLVTRQGPIASQLGAASRVDFSDNVVDGTSRQALPDPAAPGGFRAGFFWNMSNSIERLLASRNQVLCAGDRDGDGEAIAFDNDRGAENGVPGAPRISGAGADWVTVDTPLSRQGGKMNPEAGDYLGYWLQILSGRGLGQVRRIVAYERDPLAHGTRLHVAPAWDVIPEAGASRISVTRLAWGVLVVDNDVESRSPPCLKSNLTGPNSGQIGIWGSSADSAIDGNVQRDSSGIQFLMSFKHVSQGCADNCENSVAYQAQLEVRNNTIDGEYDWDSACSLSGIMGYYAAAPDAPPPILASGIAIAHNRIRHADGLGGGAISFFPGWYVGPPPETWTIALRPLVFGNTITDIGGPVAKCRLPAFTRAGIRLGEHANISGAVLSGNLCQRVDHPLSDHGGGTVRLCPTVPDAPWCECRNN